MIRLILAPLLLCTIAGAASAQVAGSASLSTGPALVVLIAVDQLRGDYPDRFNTQLTGGLARFRNASAFFPHGLQDHSNTETAPGHASMLSGREPAHTEIVSNLRGVPDSAAPLVDAVGPGASPRRFNGTTLADWLLASDPATRILSVSRKDRGAILPIGHPRGTVLWFADGKFTTSRYYADTLPTWVRAFDASIPYDRLAHSRWDLLLSDPAAYPEADSVRFENDGADFTFPHTLPSRDSLRTRLTAYPVMDSLTMALALEGVRVESLGKRRGATMPDLLSVSLSATDAIGHSFGPDSREIHDQVLRVDRWLGDFMTALEREVPADRILYVLTGDHGIAPLPEIAIVNTHRGGRVWLGDFATELERTLESRYGGTYGVEFDNGLFYGDVMAMRARGMDVDSVARTLIARALRRRGVAVGFTQATLATSQDEVAVRWRRSIPASLGWIAAFGASADFVWSPGRTIAEHGTPNALDLSVPIAFIGTGVATGRYERTVRSVDIAPTLAALIGVSPAEPLDGVVLPEAIASRTSPPVTRAP